MSRRDDGHGRRAFRPFRGFRDWLRSINRRPYTTADSFRRWAADFGRPATDAEYLAALEGGLIPPPARD